MVARLLNNIAIMKRRAGDFAGSLALNREALAIRREIGDRANEAVSLNNIGNVLLDQGDLARRGAHYEEAAVIHQAIGDRRGLARARNNAAVALKMQGQLARAHARQTRKRWPSAARSPTRGARRFPSTTSARCWRSRATW